MTRKEIISLFHKKITKEYSSGAECVFIKLNKQIGLKLYSSKFERNYAFRKQKQLIYYELAPPVYSKVCIPGFSIIKKSYSTYLKPSNKKIYGYTTEIVSLANIESERFYSQFKKLSTKLDSIGLDCFDFHEGNVGYYKHKLVFIDFGPLSM